MYVYAYLICYAVLYVLYAYKLLLNSIGSHLSVVNLTKKMEYHSKQLLAGI